VYIILIGILTFQACKQQSSSDPVARSPIASNSNASGEAKWFNNFNDAQSQSIKDQKPILVNFTSNDTCGLCKKLDTDVFSSSIFTDWAARNVVLLQIDFSVKNDLPQDYIEQHAAMARSLKVTSYPTTWILNITHEPVNNRFKVKPMGKIGYQKTPEAFIGALGNLLGFSKKVN
jgi:thioredoxin-related protein